MIKTLSATSNMMDLIALKIMFKSLTITYYFLGYFGSKTFSFEGPEKRSIFKN